MEAQNTGTLKCEHIIVKADECILPPERYHFNIDIHYEEKDTVKELKKKILDNQESKNIVIK